MKVAHEGKPTDQEINDEEEASMALLLLKNSDPKRYSSISKKLREGTFLSRDEYPVTVSTMYELMTNHDKLYHTQGSNSNRNNRGIILTQQRANSGNNEIGGSEDVDAAAVAGIDGNIINATCYFCICPDICRTIVWTCLKMSVLNVLKEGEDVVCSS